MKYASRFFLYAPIAVVLALGVVSGIYWWVAASALSKRLDALNGREAMPGVTLSFAAKTIGGFPFNLDTEFSGFSIAVETANGPTRWRAEKFAMHALTYGRDETIFEAAGRQRLEWGGGRALDFQTGALRASAILKDGALDRFDLDLIGFGSQSFTAQRLDLHARQFGKAVQLFAGAKGLTHCAVADLDHTTTTTIDGAFEKLRRGGEAWQTAIADWRAAGGIAEGDGKSPITKLMAEHLFDPTAVAEAACGK